jgi:hypothetical protein
MAIERPVSNLPLVLCGPIVRKVTRSSVSVFMALKEPRQLAIQIYEADHTTLVAAGAPVETVPLGKALHVAVVTAEAALTAGKLYSYDVGIADGHGGVISLRDAAQEIYGGWPSNPALAAAEPMFVYQPGTLPGFVCPPADRSELRILHGSCRKPHGEGSDLLALADDLLRIAGPGERPQLLLLTGDQIYADDVAFGLLRLVNQAARNLLGWRETLSSPSPLGSMLFSDAHWDNRDGDPARIAPTRRLDEIHEHSGLSSELADAHLLFLGEFLMMYVFAWSDAVWPDAMPTVDEAVPSYALAGRATKYAIAEQTRRLDAFYRTLPKVRRALANISTYMIFDDHEITDDWNLNADWVKRVHDSTMGGRVLLNGMLAYAVFQDWGNAPEDYLPGNPGADILDGLRGVDDAGEATPPPVVASRDTARALTELMGAGRAQSSDPRRKHWDFAIGPFKDLAPARPYQIILLDGRTRRGFPDQNAIDQLASQLELLVRRDNQRAGLVLSAALLDAQALRDQLTARMGTADPRQPLTLIVAPSPVFGEPLLEEVIQRLAVLATGPEFADNETWSGNAVAFTGMLDFLRTQTDGAVILSGDVHYAFSNAIEFPGPGPRPQIVQLCCSALKNETAGTVAFGHIGRPDGGFTDYLKIPFARAREIEGYLDSQVKKGLTTAGHAALGPDDFRIWFFTTPGKWWDPTSLALRFRNLNPFRLPDAFMVPVEAELATRLASGIYTTALEDLRVPLPDTRLFRSTGLSDRRGAVPAGTSRPQTDAEIAARLADGRLIDDRLPVTDPRLTGDPHAFTEAVARLAANQCREIVGYNNLGHIALSSDGNTVVHTLYWRARDEYRREVAQYMTTVHASPLVAP